MSIRARLAATRSVWSPRTQVEIANDDKSEFEDDGTEVLLSDLGKLEAIAVVVIRIRKDLLDAGMKHSYADSIACTMLEEAAKCLR